MERYTHTLTVDVSVDLERREVGVGIVIQERNGGHSRGPVVARVVECHPWLESANAEEFAILRALILARDRAFTRLKVRSDDNATRTSVRESYRNGDITAKTAVRREILALARTFDFVDFGWVPRRKNGDAHRLARSAVRSERGTVTRSDC